MKVQLPIYLDHHATTPLAPRVLEAMRPYWSQHFGNASSSSHAFGWRAEAAAEDARERLAAAIGAAEPREIVFTSGTTESDNLALKGVLRAARSGLDHLVTTQIEHPAVLDSCRVLEREGVAVTTVPVGSDGLVDPDAVAAAIGDRTALVSVMLANSEIGVIQPLAEIGRICRERGVLLHSDAAQAVGKLPVDVDALGVDLLSFCGHKLYGPKGVGALYVRTHWPRLRLQPLLDGGGHERGLRSGTLPVPLLVGFATAVECCLEDLDTEAQRLRTLRDRLWEVLSAELDDVFVNGHPERRLPGNLNVSFGAVEADLLLLALSDVALSTGSACASGSTAPSHVLAALGLSQQRIRGAVRFGLGRSNTAEEIDWVAERLVAWVREARGKQRAAAIRPAPPPSRT
ncbi:MAG: cysteine desulfurase family protein [Myxococcota bacterium]